MNVTAVISFLAFHNFDINNNNDDDIMIIVKTTMYRM